MSLQLAAHLLFGMAFALALGFHRHRAAQVLLVLWLILAGIGTDDVRLEQAALRFGPWLLLFSALLPEPRLLSRRHVLFLLLLGVVLAVALAAPPHVLASALQSATLPGLSMDAAAAALAMLAGSICLARGISQKQPAETAVGTSLALAAAGCLQPNSLLAWYVAAAGLALLGIAYTGYRMAFLDTLSGLPNRRALDETLSRLSGGFALAMVDIDHFKVFNDTHGHEAGDRVLREVARLLARHAGGRAFRYGGEEFCVTYAGQGAADAQQGLDAARAAIEACQIELPPKPGKPAARGKARRTRVSVTVSGGCAERGSQRRSAAEVLKSADQALYKAKAKGRNRVLVG
jgi:diguanylate cyclase (GGDEF)-like protein